GDLSRPVGTLFRRDDLHLRRGEFCDSSRLYDESARGLPRAVGPDRGRDKLDVCRGCAAAPPHKFCTRLYELSRVFAHILRRAHVKLTALYIARQSGVRLSGERLACDGSHFLQSLEYVVWTHPAIESD